MKRRSQRLSSAFNSAANIPSPTRKRKHLSSGNDGYAMAPRKQAKQNSPGVEIGGEARPRSSQHSTATKRTFDGATGLTSTSASEVDGNESVAEDEDVESDFSAASAVASGGGLATSAESTDEGDFTEDSASESRVRNRKPAAKRNRTGSARNVANGRGGAASLPEYGTEVIIKKPKARAAGKIAYRDETLHPNTLLFLSELQANNERSWFKMHEPDFRQAEKDWKIFVEKVTEKLSVVDDEIPELPVKDIIFRIYRDVRFSKDPTPYKPYFSAAWSRTGRKGPYAAYYLQISHDSSFIGGGSWCPESQPLSRLRADIDRHPERLKTVLLEKRMRQEFLDDVSADAKKVVQKFVSTKINKEYALKTRPQGYDKDHIDIDLLRLKNFTIGRQLRNEEVTSALFLRRVVDLMSVMKPLIRYLNGVIMPDPEADEQSEDSEDDNEDVDEEEDDNEDVDEEEDEEEDEGEGEDEEEKDEDEEG